MLSVECVVRGYLVGSGWKDYQATGAICGLKLPPGLTEGDRLPEPLFTPATKAAVGDHDENISFEQVVELVGSEDANALRETSIALYLEAAAVAEQRGLILADTKLEFGRGEKRGELVLADEAFTPDSSRYWDRDRYEAGGDGRLESFDKQIIRNWLSDHWDKTGTPPQLPGDVVTLTQQRYQELEERLTGGVG
jgi:Phosphoribosylaminoimidazolesuccinocarboxamide (SAICAR) synthase